MNSESSAPDVAARLKRAEAALSRSEKLAVANRYAGAIMHEVNNPLEALTNLIFLTKTISNDERVLAIMELAESQLKRLGEITSKSLAFYREEREAKEFDLIEIAESALKIHAQRIRNQNVDVRKRFRVPASAKVVAGEILQVISNLILNSLDASPQSDAVVHVRVRSSRAHVHITISDNCTGIHPAIHKNLFQANQTSKAHGTGFGLWLSKTIIEKHGGKISCRTSQQPIYRGTTFRVSLPIAAEAT